MQLALPIRTPTKNQPADVWTCQPGTWRCTLTGPVAKLFGEQLPAQASDPHRHQRGGNRRPDPVHLRAMDSKDARLKPRSRPRLGQFPWENLGRQSCFGHGEGKTIPCLRLLVQQWQNCCNSIMVIESFLSGQLRISINLIQSNCHAN